MPSENDPKQQRAMSKAIAKVQSDVEAVIQAEAKSHAAAIGGLSAEIENLGRVHHDTRALKQQIEDLQVGSVKTLIKNVSC